MTGIPTSKFEKQTNKNQFGYFAVLTLPPPYTDHTRSIQQAMPSSAAGGIMVFAQRRLLWLGQFADRRRRRQQVERVETGRGDLLGSVMNVGDVNDKKTRVYETNLYLPYHSDPSDVVGLLCLRQAKAGGLSSLVSVAAIYNEILAHHPEFLGLYYRPMYFAHLCEDQPSLSPIFSYHQGKLSCRYLRQYLELGHEIRQQPLSRVEFEALDLFDAIMHDPKMRLDMMLQPGDLQFANNYAVLHSRTAFQDHDDPADHRKMLRLWVKMPNARTLAPEFPGRNGFPEPATL